MFRKLNTLFLDLWKDNCGENKMESYSLVPVPTASTYNPATLTAHLIVSETSADTKLTATIVKRRKNSK